MEHIRIALAWTKFHLSTILGVLTFILIILLTLMFINFNVKIAENSNETKQLTMQTADLVKSQDSILAAIKQVTEDTRLTAAQQTSIIICMLQVPVEERTTDLQSQCRKSATSATPGNNGGTSSGSNGSGSSSHKNNASGNNSQQNISQPPKQNAFQRAITSIMNALRSVF